MQPVIAFVRAAGIRIAVDDFGKGYSNFQRVVRISPDIVKLDGELFRAACAAGRIMDTELLIRRFADHGVKTLVEGIETEEQLRIAIDTGAHYVQGYHTGAPRELPARFPERLEITPAAPLHGTARLEGQRQFLRARHVDRRRQDRDPSASGWTN
jgi:EAL domain-containing protein (putative c-di-GMP-specific phosphodiesterase class I)